MEYQGNKIELNRIREYTQIGQNKFKLVLDNPDQELEVVEFPYEIYYGLVKEARNIGGGLYSFQIDVGNKNIEIISGILNYHSIDDLLNTRQMVLVNMGRYRNFRGKVSQGTFVFANEKNQLPLLFEQIPLANGDSNRVGLGQHTAYLTKKLRGTGKYIEKFYVGLDGYFYYEDCALEVNGLKFKVIQ